MPTSASSWKIRATVLQTPTVDALEVLRDVVIEVRAGRIAAVLAAGQKAGDKSAADRGGLLAWRLLFFGLWEQIHLHQVDPEQPVWDILAAR